MLNIMVQDQFTNNQYHVLEDAEKLQYSIKQENSIFFEVNTKHIGRDRQNVIKIDPNSPGKTLAVDRDRDRQYVY